MNPAAKQVGLRSLLAALLASGACGLSACGGGSDAPPPPPPPPPTGCTSPAECDDGNACTVDTCTSGTCGSAYAPSFPGVLLGAGLGGDTRTTFTVGTTNGSVLPRTEHTFCEAGADAAAAPPRCTGELELPGLAAATFTPAASGGTVAAVLPFRFADLTTRVFQTSGTIGSGSVAIDANAACPGAAQEHAAIPVQVAFAVASDGGLEAFASIDPVALQGATVSCLAGGLADRTASLVATAGRDLVRARLAATLRGAVEAQLCSGAPCPAGFADAGGLCRRGGAPAGACLARPRSAATGLLVAAACAP